MKIFQVSLWAFTNPMRLSKAMEAAQSANDLRIAWCAIIAIAGVVLSFAFLPSPQGWELAGLSVAGVILVVIGTLDLRTSGPDSLGVMILAAALLFSFVPATAQMGGATPPIFESPAKGTIVGLLGMGVAMALAWAMGRAGLNRSFLFWPLGLCGFIYGTALGPKSGLHAALSRVPGLQVEEIYPPLLILVLLVFHMVSGITIIRSFRHLYNTENFQATPLADFRRKMGLVYLALGIVCYVLPFFLPNIPHVRNLTIAWVIGGALELNLLQWFILSIWVLTRKSIQADDTQTNPLPEPRNLLFQMPGLALEPLGLKSQLSRISTEAGESAMVVLATKLVLQTSYQKTPTKLIERLNETNPYLYFRTVRQIQAAAPAVAQTESQASQTPARSAASRLRRPSAPLTISGLFSTTTRNESLDGLVFAHAYQAPRGMEGSPLAAMPLWFPIATSPTEHLTLTHIIYRSLASVREPFRRTRIVADNVEEGRRIYTEILDWGFKWARSSFGASMLPIPISLSRLVDHSFELTSIGEEIRRASAELASSDEIGRHRLYCRAIVKLVRLGADVSEWEAQNLTKSIDAGNAWLLVEDDTAPGTKLNPVQKAFDLIFNEVALSHVAVILVTDKHQCQVLSDMQSFHPYKRNDRSAEQPKETATITPLMAILCRWTARAGSPGMMSSLVVAGIISLAILIMAVANYESLSSIIGKSPDSEQGRPRLWILVPILALGPNLIGWIAAYVWGLAGGSEEVRRASVEVIITGMVADFAWLLALLPKAMTPGLLKSVLVVLASLPGSLLMGMAVLATVGLISNIIWHRLSVRIAHRLTKDSLKETATTYHIILHIAHHGIDISLPTKSIELRELPLLVSFKAIRLIPITLSVYPDIATRLYQHLFQGLKQGFAVSSLLLEALKGDDNPVANQCLQALAKDTVTFWPDREQFGQYTQPSTSFTMNALEYVGRELCYLTNMEELIVVR